MLAMLVQPEIIRLQTKPTLATLADLANQVDPVQANDQSGVAA